MIIYKEDIEGTYNLSLEDEFDFSKVKVEDALIEKITKSTFSLKVSLLNEEDFIFNLNIEAQVNYLDAKTLDPIILNLSVSEEVPFSFNENTANELDIDFFDEEINLKELVFELILLNVPFNYSEARNENILTEKEFEENDQSRPFAQIFNKNEKE